MISIIVSPNDMLLCVYLSSQIMVDKQSGVSFIDRVQSQHPLLVISLITEDIELLAQLDFA